jgi:CRP-like cAMP-binding protein
MDRIFEYFKSYSPVSDTGWSFFKARLELKSHSAGDIIQRIHQPCTKLCFIFQGVARSYLQSSDGRDFTWYFHYNEENVSAQQFILTDYPSLNLQSPSTYGFQALTSCQIASISHKDLHDVYINFPEFLAVEKRLVVNAYQEKNIRIQSLLTQTAKDRLENFLLLHSWLFDEIPHYHIASFLGISPQRLCQLRRQHA